MTVTWSWAVEAFLGGAWTDISPDVMRSASISVQRGIGGNDVADRVATPGTFMFSLDNSEGNSGGKLGYYSPGHANCRTGWGRDTRVRLKIVSGGVTKYMIHAWVEEIEPSVGQFRERVVRVMATDYMRWLQRELNLLAVQQNQRPDQLIATAIGAVPTAPLTTSYATDPTTFPLGFHLERDEKTAYLGLIQAICKSALGYFFVAGNDTNGETVTYQNRYSRSDLTVSATLDNSMSGLKLMLRGGETRNVVRGTVYPIKIDAAATTVLASITNEFMLYPGETREMDLRVRDPLGGGERISGMDYVNPLVADTDYKMSSLAGNGGSDLNASLSFEAGTTFGANTIHLVVKNNAAVTGYVNLLQVRGKGLTNYDPIDIVMTTGAGDVSYTYQMPYQASVNEGQDFVAYVLRTVSAETLKVDEVEFRPDYSATMMGYATGLDIGARVALKEAASGLDAEFTINQVMLTIERGKLITLKWGLTTAEVTQFFTLDDDVLGVLDDTDDVLGF